MCETTGRFIKYIEKNGLLATASLLGHSDTINVKRWITKGIPSGQKAAVKICLDNAGAK